MKILIVTPRFPYPLIGGDKIKCFYLAKYLARHHDVTVASLRYQDPPPVEDVAYVEQFGIKTITEGVSPIIGALRGLRTVISRFPLEILFYRQPSLKRKVDDALRQEKFDCVMGFFMRGAQYLEDVDLPKILVAEDCRILYQTRSAEQSKTPFQKLVRLWEVFKLKSYEPQMLRSFDLTTVVSEVDLDAMRALSPTSDIILMKNGVEPDEYVAEHNADSRNGILFGGKLDTWANVLSATRVATKILPIVRESLPETTMTIIGASPKGNIYALASDVVKVEANVQSFLPYLRSAKVFVHPHEGGSGIQNKVIHAMASGCPVVTTPVGLQGIPATHEESVMVGSTDRELASHVQRLLTDTELWKRVSTGGREVIVRHLSWESIFDRFEYDLQNFMDRRRGQKR